MSADRKPGKQRGVNQPSLPDTNVGNLILHSADPEVAGRLAAEDRHAIVIAEVIGGEVFFTRVKKPN